MSDAGRRPGHRRPDSGRREPPAKQPDADQPDASQSGVGPPEPGGWPAPAGGRAVGEDRATEPVRTSRPRPPRPSSAAPQTGAEYLRPRPAQPPQAFPAAPPRPASRLPDEDAGRYRPVPRDAAAQGPSGPTEGRGTELGATAAPAPAARRPSVVGWLRQEALFTAVLVGVFAGFVLITQDRWRRGLFTVGVMLILAGLARLTLPARRAGLLVVRGRLFDTAVLLGLGAAIVGLTSAVPYLGP